MKAKVSIINSKDEIKKLPGEIEIKDNQIQLKILNLELFGNYVDKDANEFEMINLGGDHHYMALDWKSPHELEGVWKSDRGKWSDVDITIKDLIGQVSK